MLVYLIGASGVGKDSLLDAVRKRRPDLLVAHRYITRPSGVGEDSVALSPAEFEARRDEVPAGDRDRVAVADGALDDRAGDVRHAVDRRVRQDLERARERTGRRDGLHDLAGATS